MTTIAFDGRAIACDGRGCSNEVVFADQLLKIATLSDGSLLGLAGPSHALELVTDWLEGKTEFPADLGEWSALHIQPDAKVRLYTDKAQRAWREIDTPAAIGSGRELAIGAMLHGASAEEAVRIACQRDPYSGGNITVRECAGPVDTVT